MVCELRILACVMSGRKSPSAVIAAEISPLVPFKTPILGILSLRQSLVVFPWLAWGKRADTVRCARIAHQSRGIENAHRCRDTDASLGPQTPAEERATEAIGPKETGKPIPSRGCEVQGGVRQAVQHSRFAWPRHEVFDPHTLPPLRTEEAGNVDSVQLTACPSQKYAGTYGHQGRRLSRSSFNGALPAKRTATKGSELRGRNWSVQVLQVRN